MDKYFYVTKAANMLNNNRMYEALYGNKDKQTIDKVKLLTTNFSQILLKEEVPYLTRFEYKTSQLYLLPKIHNCQSIIDKISCSTAADAIGILTPHDLVFRPIIAGPACPTHRLSHLLDLLLRPFIKNVPSYVRDDIHILSKLPKV